MYHWSIGEESPYNWRFSIKSEDQTLADRVPCLELHVQYDEPSFMRMNSFNGDEIEVATGPRFGEIHLYHPIEDSYVSYLEDMFEAGATQFKMELMPNLGSNSLNVFSGVRMRSCNVYPLGGMEVMETQWVFSRSSMLVGGRLASEESELLTIDTEERPGILQHILDAEPSDLIEMESRLHGWVPVDEPVQKLDWREFGF